MSALLLRPARVAVVGVSSSGKSTLASALARRLGIPHVELDALWHDTGWVNPSEEEFRRRVSAALAASDEWVCDGNYAAVRDLVWQRATAVVWLDYARWVGPLRAVRRTVRRLVRREVLWNDNRERWQFVLSPEHPIRWSWSKHPSTRAQYGAMFADPAHAHVQLIRLRTPREAQAWLLGVQTLRSRLEEANVPDPGSKAYDTERARLRKEFEDQGLPDAKANERANAALQGDLAPSETEPRSRRDPGETRRGHGRGSG